MVYTRLFISVLFLVLTGFYPTNLYAQAITVMNTNDAGVGSLRQAVIDANSGDTILFSATFDTDTIKLTTGQMTPGKNLVFIGNGQMNTIIDGQNSSRIFQNDPGDTIEIHHLTIQNGRAGNGGAINNMSILHINNCFFNYNHATSLGGVFYNDPNGTVVLTIRNSVFSDNSAVTNGGVGRLEAQCEISNSLFLRNTSGGGGAINHFGPLSITNSIFIQNSATFNGGAIQSNSGDFIVSNCRFESNTAGQDGGALAITNNSGSILQVSGSTIIGNTSTEEGGGIYAFSPNLMVNNCQLSGNTAGFDGGGLHLFVSTGVRLKNNTIAGNTSGDDGGGISGFASTATITNTIIAGNFDSGGTPDIYRNGGNYIDGGTNLIGDTSGVANIFTVTTLKGGPGNPLDPMFIESVPVDDSLGGNLTLVLCSPALNAGNNDSLSSSDSLDLLSSPRIFSGTVDIGAFETQGSSGDTLTVVNTSDSDPGSLRYLIDIACADVTIRFDPVINADTIKLSSGEITIDTNIVIVGNDSTNTIIDGQNTTRLFHVESGDTATFIGLTLQNASSGFGSAVNNLGQTNIIDCYIHHNQCTSTGGAIASSNDLLSIRNSNFVYNSSNGTGGAIRLDGDCEIMNSSFFGNSGTNGGAIDLSMGNVVIHNSQFRENSALSGGGALVSGTGVLEISDCVFESNISGSSGGGALNLLGGAGQIVRIDRSRFSGNHTAGDGGGIHNWVHDFKIANSLFSGNSAENNGGGIHFFISNNAQIKNNTFSGNIAGNDGGGISGQIANVTITNTILAKNMDTGGSPEIFNNSSTYIDGGNNLIGDTSGVANTFPISTLKGGPGIPFDPLFVEDVPMNDSIGGILHLRRCSPAIDAGNNDSLGVADSLDLDRNPRIFNAIVDIGAYDFQRDINGDLIVMNSDDSGLNSLRDLIGISCDGDTITFDAATNGDTIILTSNQLNLRNDLVIIGNNDTSTVINGDYKHRIFEIGQDNTVALWKMTLMRGLAGSISDYVGGNILNRGSLTLKKVQILAGHSTINGGGVYNEGNLYVFNSKFLQNRGALANVDGFVFIYDSEFSSNSSTVLVGGITNVDGLLNIDRTVLRNNSTTFGVAAGISNSGAGENGFVSIKNSIVAGNYSNFGAASGIANTTGTIEIVNSTIAGNQNSPLGGGIYNQDTIIMANSIVAQNYPIDNVNNDIFNDGGSGGHFIDSGNNIIGDTSNVANLFPNSVWKGSNANPLNPLFFTDVPDGDGLGGDLRLLSCSPGINSGSNSNLSAADTVDVAGNARVQNMNVDIGAYESPYTDGKQNIYVTNANDVGPGSLRNILKNLRCDGDTIRFVDSINMQSINLLAGQIDIDVDVVIIGNDTSNTIIDAQGLSRIFEVMSGDSVQLWNMKLQNGHASGSTPDNRGGGIYNNGTLSIYNSTIADCTAESFGGGILSEDNSVFINDSRIRNNSTGVSLGGGIYIKNGLLSINNSEILYNHSDANGGGVFATSDVDAVISNSRLQGNTANQGAAVFFGSAGFEDNSIIIDNCNFVGNLSELVGGGLVLGNPRVALVKSSNFINNAANNAGGAISFIGSDTSFVQIEYSYFANNKAKTGGAVFAQGLSTKSSTISYCEFRGNSALVLSGGSPNAHGGALYSTMPQSVEINTCLFSGNYAEDFGGGVYSRGSVSIRNSTLAGNHAVERGGGLYVDEPSASDTSKVGNTIIGNNTTDNDGPDVYHSTFSSGVFADLGNNLIGNDINSDGVFATSILVGTELMPLDPMFYMDVPETDVLEGDFHLRHCSPAINSGNNGLLSVGDTLDFEGSQRIVNGVVDVGAYEYQFDSNSDFVVRTANDFGITSLRHLITIACEGDTIRFADSINMQTIALTSGEIEIDIDLVIIGNDTSNTIIDAQGLSRIFNINSGDSLQLWNLKLQNGQASGADPDNRGGGVYNNGVVSIYNSTIANCSATDLGGGIFCEDGSINVHNSRIHNNESSTSGGGGIYIKFGRLTITNSEIINNHVEAFGGGIFSSTQVDIRLINSLIRGNTSNQAGGGMFCEGTKSSLIMDSCHVVENYADQNGGGIFVFDQKMALVQNSEFVRNTSNNFGGALLYFALDTGSIQIEHCNFTSNISETGGAILIQGLGTRASSIKYSEFRGNSAVILSGTSPDASGGAIYSSMPVPLEVINCSISGNHSEDYGGGIYSGGSVSITGTTITGNHALERGGGLYVDEALVTDTSGVGNTIIAKNTSDNEGPDVYHNPSAAGIFSDLGNNLIGNDNNSDGVFTASVLIGTQAMPIDPVFLNNVPQDDSLGGDFNLSPCSPAIDAGSNSLLSNTDTLDLGGISRIIGDSVDIGAYESEVSMGPKIYVVANSNDAGSGSLRDIIDGIRCHGDTIRFDKATNMDTIKLTSGQMFIGYDVVIIGNDTSNTIIDAQQLSRIFEIDEDISVEIFNMRMINGVTDTVEPNRSGGAIFSKGVLRISSSIIEYCTADDEGGAIQCQDTFNANNVIFRNNNARHGGAMYIGGTGGSVVNCDIIQNTAEQAGGIRVSSANFDITNCTLRDNTSLSGGAILYIASNSNELRVSSSVFQNNYSFNSGGAIFCLGNFELTECLFASNQCEENGGAVYWFGSINLSIQIDSCVFESNLGKNGGAVNFNKGFISGDSSSIRYSKFKGNASTRNNGGSGGALYLTMGDYLNIINCEFSGNESQGNGGAVFSRHGVDLRGNTITGNHSNNEGGGIFTQEISSNDTSYLSNCIIAKNTSVNNNSDVARHSQSLGVFIDQGNNLIGNAGGYDTLFTTSILVGDSVNPIDPLFMEDVPIDDSLGGDFNLRHGSPAKNAGNNALLIGFSAFDLAGNDRIYDNGVVDIGAYEFKYEFPCGLYNTLMVDESPIPGGLYRAILDIQSTGVVGPGSNSEVIFKSENEINLEPGFEVQLGQEFLATPESPCVD